MARPLTLLTVHGHPDDETVTVGGVMARYAAEGLRVACVTATRGEVGEIVAPDLDTPANRERLGEVREAEERQALACLGPIELRFLGYRDSGMMGTSENLDPRAFWQADPDEAAGRLVRIVRELQADVIVAPNEFGGDGHPDHRKASQIARLAYERAGDPTAYPEQLAGGGLEPWAPAKLYEPVNQFGRRQKLARALRSGDLLEAGSMALRWARHWRPGRERHRTRMAAAQRPATTLVDVGPYLEAKYLAMAAHRTQIAPDADLFALSPAERRRVTPTEDFTLRDARLPVQLPENDLFAGLREGAAPAHESRP
ncbi:MAG: PIG-L deacetylase family protein [Candidatus Limnocylindrales bacterium]